MASGKLHVPEPEIRTCNLPRATCNSPYLNTRRMLMKKLIVFLAVAGLLAACAAPPAAQPPSQAPTPQSLPEVTVFRSPT